MAIEVFNRYEKKYLLNEKTYERLLARLSGFMVPDSHSQNSGFYKISNIYYDTPDDRLIRNSIEKPVYKEKFRVRSYGVPSMDDLVFVEIKKKYNGIVNKRRTALKLEETYNYLDRNILPDLSREHVNKQVFNEIDYFKHFYSLTPKVYLSYDRKAYFETDQSDFRVTFDTNITTRREDVRLECGSYGSRLLPDNMYLMEVKISTAAPLWFTKIISEYNIFPVSFSKYGTEYKNFILNGIMKGETICLNQFLHPQQTTLYQLAHQC